MTVEEVEEWWNNSTRLAKTGNLIEKEHHIVEAYYRVSDNSFQKKLYPSPKPTSSSGL